MLHILWMILKIIGIVLLIIIGLLLVIVLSVLLVPVRYRGRISYLEKPEGILRVSWLLHILSLRMEYDKEMTAVIRIAGIPIWKKTLFGEDDVEEFVEELPENVADIAEQVTKRSEDVVAEADDNGGEAEDRPADSKPSVSMPADSSTVSKGAGESDRTNQKTAPARANTDPEPEEAEKEHFFTRIKDKIIGFVNKLQFSFRNFCDKLKGLLDKKNEILEFVNNEDNRKTFSLVLRQCKRLIRHIRPGKVKGRVAFGFADPYTTGQVLMYASPFLGWYHKWLNLEPYFDREILEGEVAFRGRIRIGSVLFLGYLVYRDRNFRKLLKAFRE